MENNKKLLEDTYPKVIEIKDIKDFEYLVFELHLEKDNSGKNYYPNMNFTEVHREVCDEDRWGISNTVILKVNDIDDEVFYKVYYNIPKGEMFFGDCHYYSPFKLYRVYKKEITKTVYV